MTLCTNEIPYRPHSIFPIDCSQYNSDLYCRALFQRPESLGALLPYDEFIDAHKIFRMKDGSLGVVFEAEILEHEPMTTDQIVAAVDGLRSWFNLPPNCVLQLTFDQAAVSPLDASFERHAAAFPDAHPVSNFIFDERMRRIRAACNTNAPLAPLSRRLLVSIRYFPLTSLSPPRRELFKRGEAVLHREMKDFVREMSLFSHLVTDFQHSSKIPSGCWTPRRSLTDSGAFQPQSYYKGALPVQRTSRSPINSFVVTPRYVGIRARRDQDGR